MNPFRSLTRSAPFLADIDAEAIKRFNAKAPDHHRVHLEIVPEPYLGNPLASVVLLNLNPGFVDDDRNVHNDEAFNAAARANLTHEHPDYPFYLLDPAFPSPGQEWWRRKLRTLIAAVESDPSRPLRVASQVFVAELHGYHSRRFSARLQVPSQEYTKHLVRAAIDRGATFVVMRGRKNWISLVPELAHASVAHVRNVQNPAISPANLPDAFDKIVAALRES